MKILLVFSEKEKYNTYKLFPKFDKLGLITETLQPISPDDLRRSFIPHHTLITSSLTERCIDFFAGFSCAANQRFPVFGDEATAAIPDKYSDYFVLITTEAALINYFEVEKEAFRKGEAEREYHKARNALLEMGIPVNIDALANCSAEGSIQELFLFLAAGFSPNTLNKTGIPLLNLAARKGNKETLRILITHDADLNQTSSDRGSSALIDSVMGKHPELAKELIKAGADLDIKSKSGQTALVIAVGADDEKVVEALLEAGADPDIADSMGVSARKYATLFHKENLMALFKKYAPEPSAEK